jgi:hypothetical protein
MLVANAHESMQHQAEQQISMLKKQAELLMKQAPNLPPLLVTWDFRCIHTMDL